MTEKYPCRECGEELTKGVAEPNIGFGYCFNPECPQYKEWVSLDEEE
jgi:hypothetical protein